MIVEKDTWFMNGYISSFVIALLLFIAFLNVFHQEIIIAVISFILAVVLMTGLTIVKPNDIVIVMFLGTYIGTIRKSGWTMTVPFTNKIVVSRKIRRFTTDEMTIQLQDGTRNQLSTVITYQVVDAAKAIFTVDDYIEYMKTEAYLLSNQIANEMYREQGLIDITTLNEEVKRALQSSVNFAGIDIVELHCIFMEGTDVGEG